ncbi:hypothetical protein JHK82_032106 [Glycine max]|nr:hypothetical protein JHK87_032040 [Glycine soja]KAG4989798.1 hypothetical protein JHK85_032781 [Glycine max]KAG4995380.1 hypothetical protein JHK86_032207 [Glycine max]KAG5125369.1 hypothetical protein JHK82_032106 [Glycine max]KAG5146802.1 hypothetical protein JHK84_032345 [Glycine max]
MCYKKSLKKVKDRKNHYTFCITNTVSDTSTPNEAEAWALHSVILWIKRLGLSNVVIETDYKADYFQVNTKGSTDFHVILNSWRDLLLSISNSRVNFIKRRVNHVTYNLGRATKFYANSHVFDYILSCIISHIVNQII